MEVLGGSRFAKYPWLKYYVLILLFLAGVISYIDRKIIAVLLESIKADLLLTDTQMGLLAGVFFSASYIIAGVPLARLSDFGDRRSIIAACMAVWSAATAFCGFATSYFQLALARAFVGIGEAGSAPASFSLLADLFPAEQRARVFSVVSCGSAVGLAFGFYLAGTLSELLGWRTVFIVVGLPGLVFAALVWLTVPEPLRPVTEAHSERKLSLIMSLATLLRLRTYRWVMIVLILASTTAYAVLAWAPTFFIRVHHLSTGEIGLKMGAAVALGLLLGNLSSGALADRLARRDTRWLIWVAGYGILACIPFGLLAFFWPTANGSLVFLGFYMYFMGFWSPPLVTVAVGLVDTRSRALAASTIPIMQAIGGALGPLFVGFVNDQLVSTHGDDAIRYSLAAALSACAIGGACALLAGKSLVREYRSPVLLNV